LNAWIVLAGVAAVTLSAQAQAGGEPTWPQKFEIRQGENRGFAFVVTQPGPVSVNITSQGAPITVTLSGPTAEPFTQTGSGTINISHSETAAEVQRSAIWLVIISSGSGAPSKGKAPPVVASGMITVTHPRGDMRVAEAEVQRKLSAHRPVATTAAVSTHVVSPMQAAYAQQLAMNQAHEKQALMGQIHQHPPVSPMAAKPMAKTAPKTTAPGVRTSGNSGSNSGSGSTTSSAPAAAPVITSLSVSHGQPGDPILINGSGFGATQGQSKVHLIVGPGKDVTTGQVDFWSDNQIMTYVPFKDSLQKFSGEMYFQGANGKSNLVQFEYDPLMQFVVLDLKLQNLVQAAGGFASIKGPNSCRFTDTGPWEPGTCVDHSVSPNTAFNWTNNDDEFFQNLRMKNGWTTAEVDFRGEPGAGGGAYLAEERTGSNSPYAKVHWWLNPFGEAWYTLTITISGPSGLPYQ
jgi:hypothetical protein